MVCIIDDREDVWNYARNLICVQPYVFFKNTGDINDPTQQQQKNQTKASKSVESTKPKTINSQTKSSKSSDQNVLTENELAIDNNSVDSSSSSSTNSNDSIETKTNNNSQNKNSKQNKENQLGEQKTDDQESQEDDENYDPDDYLIYLENILRKIHDEYYRFYQQRLKNKSISSDQVDEANLPDLKKVLPLIKSKVLENVVITFSGVVPTGYDLKKQRCYIMATSLGAKVNEHLVLPDSDGEDNEDSDTDENQHKKYEYSYDDDETSSSSNCSGGNKARKHDNNKTKKKQYTTHLVAAKHGTSKVHEALKCTKQKIYVVTPEWLINSNYKWIKCDEKMYRLTKEYDYKNCIFHNEYNMHQKYASASMSIQTNTAKLLSASKRNINQQVILESEFKTKKYKLNKEEDVEDEENFDDDMKINEDLLSIMDKEVDKELDEEDDEEEDDEEDDNENNDEEEEEAEDFDDENEPNKHDTTSSDDADISSNAESIDEDMISALERDFN